MKLPDALSFAEAATLPCAGLTAWVGLVEHGKLAPSTSGGVVETVLAMGTGGVSIFAVQIAKALGADEVINYRTEPAWDERARALTGGRGVDHILEVAGEKTMPISVKAVREGGHVSLVGLLTGGRADANLPEVAARKLCVDSVHVGCAESLAAFTAFVVQKQIRPVVDEVFDFERAKDAYLALERGQHFGKIVVHV